MSFDILKSLGVIHHQCDAQNGL